jgi:hypothetical protein
LPFDEKLRDLVRLAFAGVPKVKEKKYFNGAVFMVDGKLCISIGRIRSCYASTLPFTTN